MSKTIDQYEIGQVFQYQHTASEAPYLVTYEGPNEHSGNHMFTGWIIYRTDEEVNEMLEAIELIPLDL